jgi:SAM-dependent methyltransferase
MIPNLLAFSRPGLPIPPLEMRELVGCVDVGEWDNESGLPIWPNVPAANRRSYLDFGCGCGRSARRLIQQKRRPERYVGVDINDGMIAWCQENLTPRAPGFTFLHHDVYSPGLNPNRLQPWALPLPVPACSTSGPARCCRKPRTPSTSTTATRQTR